MKKLVPIFLVLALLFSACGYSKEDLEEAYWKGYYDAEDEHKYDYDNGDSDGYWRGLEEAEAMYEFYREEGYDEGYKDGKNDGYDEGYEVGEAWGYEAGWNDCENDDWDPPPGY